MVKEFKYKPGDLVWFMYENKPICGKISKCLYRKSISCVDYESVSESEMYYVSLSLKSVPCVIKEVGDYGIEDLFPDKQSLLKSL